MATRDEEAARWRAISRNSRKAAQHLLEAECYRSSISRVYYAAYGGDQAITSALIRQGITLAHDGNNPSHISLPTLVLNNLTFLPPTARFDLNRALRRLYGARIEADYNCTTLSDRTVAVNSLRDLRHILLLMGTDRKEADQ